MQVLPQHFEYLKVQRGDISHLRHDFARWQVAYDEALCDQYAQIRPFLPKKCESVLDMGSGLGGIDTLVAKSWPKQPRIVLLDGKHTPARVDRAYEPYNDMAVAIDFLVKNGVQHTDFYTPENFHCAQERESFDLVMSSMAYGFHIHPAIYMAPLLRVIRPDTVVILDVRFSKNEWVKTFSDALGPATALYPYGKKHVRFVYRAPK